MAMSDEVQRLYQERNYPAMSHPSSDPAVTSVAAILAGLRPSHPRGARILEVGCASGHHLIPLAQRWPESQFTGIDLAVEAIHEAENRAKAAGVTNINFQCCDLRDFKPHGFYDYIIAHGIFSWVPTEVRTCLLRLCRNYLSRSGIATISFNVQSGWEERLPLIQKIRAIQAAGAVDEVEALGIFRSLLHSSDPLLLVVDDMLAKGRDILPFDDFSPVNEPFSLEQFTQVAASEGLRWLGESDPGNNLSGVTEKMNLVMLQSSAHGPIDFQNSVDEMTKRTFRSGLLCRDDAPIHADGGEEAVLHLSLREGDPQPYPWSPSLLADLRRHRPSCVPVEEIWTPETPEELRALGRLLVQGIFKGRIYARIEPVRLSNKVPWLPKLDAFRLLCARQRLPLVDVWHKPCSFPYGHYEVLAKMDGSQNIDQLTAFSRQHCPELNFAPWLHHLALRGLFT